PVVAPEWRQCFSCLQGAGRTPACAVGNRPIGETREPLCKPAAGATPLLVRKHTIEPPSGPIDLCAQQGRLRRNSAATGAFLCRRVAFSWRVGQSPPPVPFERPAGLGPDILSAAPITAPAAMGWSTCASRHKGGRPA